jgi:uncharacterized membrane protein
VEISQQDFEQLLEQVRQLTARVHQLETLFDLQGTQPETAPVPPVRPAVLETLPPPRTYPPYERTIQSPPPPPPPPPRFVTPSVPEEGSNLEARIGSHWLNRIGIAAVLIGVSYFLKLAFDSNWIGPAGRIAVGLIAGIAVVLWSERFRSHGYRIFSYSLKAVGIGVLYLSLWAAYQEYQLVSPGFAFFCMVIVTAATCAMAWSQDAEILAVFAIAGGFSTPALVSTGQNREIALFLYVVLLDLGILALVTFKPWRRLLLLGFLGTLLLYIAWYSEFYSRGQIAPTLFFATFFFLIFAVAPLLMLRQESGAGTMPLILAFVNAGTYFLQAYAMIMEISHTEMAWFSLALAAVYLGLNRLRPESSDSAAEHNLHLMHLALAVGLVTVAIPIRLDGHWITIGWLVEAAALLWVGQRVKSDLLNVFALAALVLGVARLLLAFDDFNTVQPIFNMRMATYAIAIAVMGLVAYGASKREDESAKMVGAVAVVAMNALALRGLSLEIADYYSRQIAAVQPGAGTWRSANWTQMHSIEIARDFTYSALFMAYGAMLMVVGFWRSSAFVRWQALLLIAATIVKVFVYDTSQLDRIYRILSFIVLGVLLLAISFAYQRDWLRLSKKSSTRGATA